MKYFIALLIAGGLYFVCFRTAPVGAVTKTMTEAPAAPTTTAAAHNASSPQHSNALKRPLDRTHEVLGQVQKNNAENAF